MKKVIIIKDVSNRKLFCLLLTALTSIILIAGCSKDMSRDRAREVIINHFKYPITETEQLDIGSNIKINGMKIEWLESLEHDGLIDYTYRKRFLNSSTHIVSISLTDKGKAYVVGDTGTRGWPNAGQKYVEIKFAERQFVEITGIKTSDDKKEAIVEYTWKYGNFYPFSKGWRDTSVFSALVGSDTYDENKTYKEEVYMALYDDGWRIRQ